MRSPPERSACLIVATALLTISAGTAPASAQDRQAGPSASTAQPRKNEEIIVSGHALRDMGLMAGAVEIETDDLLRAGSAQIGDLLAKLPGISATSFAPGASRPVLRGQTGDRVQVLIDGIGSIDLSSVSADHGVALDTLTIDHIDVLHGPALLAFGGQSIGGAVIAYDKRIPRQMPDGPIDLIATGSLGTVSGGKSAAGSIDVPLSDTFVAHVDGSWHDNGNLRTGGSLLSAPLRAEVLTASAVALVNDDPQAALELQQIAGSRGRIENSFARGTSFGAGLAYIGEGGNLGVSVQRIDNLYGIPARPITGEEGVSIDLAQTRLDFRGHLEFSGSFARFFESLHLRGAYADYHHIELEENGEVGSRFARKAGEARLELIQADNGGWTGRSGLQYSRGTLRLSGEEAILPDNRVERIAAFTFQSWRLGKVELEAAGRLERVSTDAVAVNFQRDVTLRSAAAGIAWYPIDALKLGVNFTHGERAPSPEELLTDGVHVATQSFEIGNRGFARERSDNFEAYARFESETTNLRLAIYRNDFKGFITTVATGGQIEGFPVFEYRQLPARFQGFELQGSQRLTRIGNASLILDASADYVRARIKGVGPAPRIPPLRLQAGLEYEAPALTLRGEVEWNDAQNRVAALENPTPSFALVDASAIWRPMSEDGPLMLILSAENLLDVVARRAASFTRDFVPLPGRNFRITARVEF